jgi:hypothetical protein
MRGPLSFLPTIRQTYHALHLPSLGISNDRNRHEKTAIWRDGRHHRGRDQQLADRLLAAQLRPRGQGEREFDADTRDVGERADRANTDHDIVGWVDDIWQNSIQPPARLMSTPHPAGSHSGLRSGLMDRRLVDMSNLAIMADAGTAKILQFNAIFYATIATIIPVLFVAAALQDDTYAKIIQISRAAYHRKGFRARIIFVGTAFIPVLILGYGVVGEIWVLVDLYLQHPIVAGPFIGGVGPLIAAGALTVAVSIGPAEKFVSLLYEMHRPAQPSKTAENPAGKETHKHETAPSEPSPHQDGKPSSGQTDRRGQP